MLVITTLSHSLSLTIVLLNPLIFIQINFIFYRKTSSLTVKGTVQYTFILSQVYITCKFFNFFFNFERILFCSPQNFQSCMHKILFIVLEIMNE